jgi:hypothetical protein
MVNAVLTLQKAVPVQQLVLFALHFSAQWEIGYEFRGCCKGTIEAVEQLTFQAANAVYKLIPS